MNGFIVVAHQPLASAFIQCIAHVMGSQPPSLLAIDVEANQSPTEVAAQITQAAANMKDCTGIFVIGDLFGATPSNAANMAVNETFAVPAQLIAGCNVSMLLRGLTYRDLPFTELAEKIVSGGRHGIVSTGSSTPQRHQNNPLDNHGSAIDNHQQ